jgi:hypothetical protein
VAAGRLHGADRIGLKVGRIINKYKMAKHFELTITDTAITLTRKHPQNEAEAVLDGVYVLRTSVPTDQLDAPGVVTAYKQLSYVERDFRHIKADDLALRPIHHRLPDRVRAHVLIAMLAAYLVWHLRRAWAPLTFTDENPPQRENPVAPAQRSDTASRKASRRQDEHDQPVRSFRGILEHLATLTRNHIRITDADNTEFDLLATPTPTQRKAFDLLQVAIPNQLT